MCAGQREWGEETNTKVRLWGVRVGGILSVMEGFGFFFKVRNKPLEGVEQRSEVILATF